MRDINSIAGTSGIRAFELPTLRPEAEEAFSNPVCPAVAIGVSAETVEALELFFKALLRATGWAFVIVQHSETGHNSNLVDLLPALTWMNVTEAAGGMTIEPNHIYVAPPDTQISIRRGTLHVTGRPQDRLHWFPIDSFFCALAEDRESRAVGVLLGGGASDGVLGLKAIRSVGGITFARSDADRLAGLSLNAGSASLAEFMMSPQSIARELESISKHSYLAQGKSEPGIVKGPAFQELLSFLSERSGVNLLQYKEPPVLRRLARRMALCHFDRIEDYFENIKHDSEEIRSIIDDILINITEFFRDKQAFAALSRTALSGITRNRKPETPVRIWVAGCSTGEEVYSIAISVAEYLERTHQHWPVQIFGTDVNERAIQYARAGKYRETIARVVSQEQLRRYFTKLDGGGYQIAAEIREQCIFSRQDVTKDPPLARMDLISCRNLLIYLDHQTQRRVLSAFHYALQPTGVLFLGHSESVGVMSDYFVARDRAHKLFCRNLQQPAPYLDVFPALAAASSIPGDPPSGSHQGLLDREVDRVLAADYGPGGFLVNADLQIVRFRGNTGPYIAPPSGNDTFNVLKLVRKVLAHAVSSALEETKRTGLPSARYHVEMQSGESVREIDVIVRPISDFETDRHFLILFEEMGSRNHTDYEKKNGPQAPSPDLELQLELTRTYMQSVIEELRQVNQEVQSNNEELQSMNEELQTAKQELQSSNEELSAISNEMESRNGELNEINDDLLNLFSSLDMPIVMLNRNLQVRRFTPASARVLNLTASDLGRPIGRLKLHIDVPDLEQMLVYVIDSVVPVVRQLQDIGGHWYSLRISPYRTSENRIGGAVLKLIDIDQLKRTLYEVESARDYSEAILSTIREPLLVLDPKLRVKSANHSFFEVFGAREDETVGSMVYDLGNGQWNTSSVRQLLETVLRDAEGRIQTQDVEMECYLPRTGLRTFQLNARRVRENGTNGLVLVALEDITDRKRAAEARYRRLFETAKHGIVVADAGSGEITDVNPSVVEVFGYPREQMLGKAFWDAGPLAEMQDAHWALEQLRTEDFVRFADVTLRASNGRTIDAEVTGNVSNEGERRVIQFNIRDMTERKRFNERLQHTAKLESLGVLAGGVAHDFNNLLTSIMGNASLALETSSSDEGYRSSLLQIVKASHRAADLTRQMLAYAGKGRFIVGPVGLSELVQEIAGLVKSSIPKSVDLEFSLASDLPPVHADSGQLQQLIMNLIINAAEAIREGERGSVRIVTGQGQLDQPTIRAELPDWDIAPGRFVSLEITDTGSGMDEATKAKIFDPFFTTKFTGRGLGLAAALGIVRGHKGAILVTSAVGEGSTFKVILPAAQSVTVAVRPEGTRASLQGSGLVLVADDEDVILQLAKAAFETHGYSVVTAENGEAAVEIFRQRAQEFRLAILDLTMPVMGGVEARRKIGAIRPDLPVILSSGYDQTQVDEDMTGWSYTRFLQKPYTVARLLEAAKSAVA